MVTLTEGRHSGEGLTYEAPNYFSRKEVLLAANESVEPGQVLGEITSGGAVTVAKTDVAGANKGVITLANPAYGAGVMAGKYKVVFIEPATDAGAFIVEGPDGVVIGNGNVGVAFTGVVKFTVADGTSDFVAGDTATLTVSIAAPAAVGQFRAWDPDATDGSELACAIAHDAKVAPADAPVRLLTIYQHAIWREADMVFKAGTTPEEKAQAISQLGKAQITTR